MLYVISLLICVSISIGNPPLVAAAIGGIAGELQGYTGYFRSNFISIGFFNKYSN